MAQLKSFSAIVVSVMTTDKNDQPLMKTRADGSKSPYSLCNLKITEGPLKGKSLLAQRSLENRLGIAKETVAVGDEVFATMTSIVVNRTTGGKMPMFEVTTSSSASTEDLLAAFGDSIEESTPAIADVKIPLAS